MLSTYYLSTSTSTYFFSTYNYMTNSVSIHYPYAILFFIHILPIACLHATYIPLVARLYTTIYYLCPCHLRSISCIISSSPHPPDHKGRGQPHTLPRYLILRIDRYVHVCVFVIITLFYFCFYFYEYIIYIYIRVYIYIYI